MSSNKIDIGFCDDELLKMMKILNPDHDRKFYLGILDRAKKSVLKELLPMIRTNNSDKAVTKQYETCALLLKCINRELNRED